jgi:tetratricopeptide (TPR) repeat protein
MTWQSLQDRFGAALLLGFDHQEERAIQELRALVQEATGDEERGWIILYEARFLGHLLRVAEARQRLADLRSIWTRTAQHDASIAVGEASLYEAEGDSARALTEFDRILKEYADQWHLSELQEPYEEVQANRGRLLVGQDRCMEALPLLEETLRSEKGKPGEFYYNLGYCYFMAEQWEESERWLKHSLIKKLDPGCACLAHYYLGRLEYRLGALEEAVKEYEAAAKHAGEAGSSRKVIYGELARAYNELGNKEQALHYSRLHHSGVN